MLNPAPLRPSILLMLQRWLVGCDRRVVPGTVTKDVLDGLMAVVTIRLPITTKDGTKGKADCPWRLHWLAKSNKTARRE